MRQHSVPRGLFATVATPSGLVRTFSPPSPSPSHRQGLQQLSHNVPFTCYHYRRRQPTRTRRRKRTPDQPQAEAAEQVPSKPSPAPVAAHRAQKIKGDAATTFPGRQTMHTLDLSLVQTRRTSCKAQRMCTSQSLSSVQAFLSCRAATTFKAQTGLQTAYTSFSQTTPTGFHTCAVRQLTEWCRSSATHS